jgi:hypothetical protein
MFKGPAILTAGSSIIGATFVSTDDLIVNDDLTVNDDLSAQDIVATTSFRLSNNTVNSINIGSGGAEGTVLATKSYVDTAINYHDNVMPVVTAMTGNNYNTIDVGQYNTIFFGNTSNTTETTLTASITFSSPRNGHRLFIAWVAKGVSSGAVLYIDISNSSSPTSSGNTFIIGPAGHSRRYIKFLDIGDNIHLYYVGAPLNKWITNSNTGIEYVNNIH